MKPTFNHSFLWNLVWKQHQTMVVVGGGGRKRPSRKEEKRGHSADSGFLFPSLKLPLDLRQSSHRGIAAHPYT